MLVTILLLISISFVVSVLVTPVVRSVAERWRLVDLPDNGRKVHTKPVARIGGSGIFVAYFGSLLAVSGLLAYTGWDANITLAAAKTLVPAAVIVFLTGALDDVWGLRAWQKLAGEIAAGILLIASGIVIRGPVFDLHPVIGALCTIGWLVICINAVNLIDGLDGLAAGIAFLATTTIAVASLLHGTFELTIAAVPLLGALLGFLLFNFNPASIFLGDGGSLFIGFLLACYSIMWSDQSHTIPKMAAPLIALAVPLVDTTLAIFRRSLRAQSIFSPDRSHIHHRLLARGLSHRRAVLLLYAITVIAGACSLWLIASQGRWELYILAAFVGGVILAVKRLGYAEFKAARRVLTRRAFQEEVNAQLAVQGLEDRLRAAQTANERWAVIRDASQALGFHPIHLRLDGQVYAYEPAPSSMSMWALHMPISQDEWIDLFHEIGPPGGASAVIPFAETILKVLGRGPATAARQGSAFAAAAGVAGQQPPTLPQGGI